MSTFPHSVRQDGSVTDGGRLTEAVVGDLDFGLGAETDAEATALRTTVDHRDELVMIRNPTVNLLHVVLTSLVRGGTRAQLGRRSYR
jgi:hypothetical protein